MVSSSEFEQESNFVCVSIT